MKEFRQGFFIVWAALSIAALFILTVPFVLPESTIYKITPVCESKRLGLGQCPLCGMTTAFIEISKGDFTNAFNSNRASLALYSLLVLNQIIFLGRFAFKKLYFRKLFIRL
ncbi:MAG: DUF2752 domain-containing protein [Bacteroidota bacterium]